MDELERYLGSLVGCWDAFAVGHRGARVIRAGGFAGARFPGDPGRNHAVLLDPAAAPALQAAFRDLPDYVVWAGDSGSAQALAAAGLVPKAVGTPMVRRLDVVLDPHLDSGPGAEPDADDPAGVPPVEADVAPRLVAEIADLAVESLTEVPGLRAFATADGASGLVSVPVGTGVHLAFLTTRRPRRRQGLASAVLAAALRDARDRGYTSACLQATGMAERLCGRIGFTPITTWIEWRPGQPGQPGRSGQPGQPGQQELVTRRPAKRSAR